MTGKDPRARLDIVVAGHVDHGKSTVVGRLLADTGSLPQGKLDRIRDFCARNAKPFEYAFLLDALKDEQGQGITIDAARIFFKTARRDYMIIDAPGHVEFLKNMVSGASHASAALLVIDAAEGIRENSMRHAYLLRMLGVRQVCVLVNKMDAVGYDERAFLALARGFTSFLDRLGVKAAHFVPTAAAHGDNIALRSAAMPWYAGPTVLEALDGFQPEPGADEKPFRMPVQDVYKFTASGDDRRIFAGTVESGAVAAGDELVFYPSGKTAVVTSLEGFPRAAGGWSAGEAAGLTLADEIYVRRGEIAAKKGEPRPAVAKRARASVFWLGREPLRPGRDYVLKLATARVKARLESVVRALDASTLEELPGRTEVRRHEAADCVFEFDAPLAFELPQAHAALGRFVLVDDHEISGGGLIREALPDRSTQARELVMRRNLKWRRSFVGLEQREARLRQHAGVVLVTGSDEPLRRDAAKELESRLFGAGRFVYFLGIGSLLYGVDADIRAGAGDHAEDMRRLAEVAHIMVDTGLILIVTASRLTAADADLIRTSVDAAKVLMVWVGPGPAPDLGCDLTVDAGTAGGCADRIESLLREKGFLPG